MAPLAYQTKIYRSLSATAKSEEGEFNKLKTFVIQESLRADKFVEKHVNYLIGRILIVDAQIPSNSNATIHSNDAIENMCHLKINVVT